MSRRSKTRNPLFHRRRFADEMITLSVIWYLRFKLSYRDLSEIARQFGVLVAPCTILRWVVRYAADFKQRWQAFECPLDGPGGRMRHI
jgi:transposase-like protein